MATLKDIAREANVSVMTVSRVFNNPEKVSNEIKDKILKIADEKNYKVNNIAKSLVTNKTGIIQINTGLKSTDPYFMLLFAGITEQLSKNNYSIIVGNKDIRMKCDGLIVMTLDENSEEYLSNVDLPCVIFGKTDLKNIDCVDIENYSGIYKITNYLIENGHTEIAYLGIDNNENFSKERKQGYVNALEENNINVNENLIFKSKNELNSAIKICNEILINNISAVVCASDILAITMIDVAKSLRLNVPEDLSVTGFDGIFYNKMYTKQLTTVKQPVYEVGVELAKLIIDKIKNKNKNKVSKIIDIDILFGDTVKKSGVKFNEEKFI